MARRECLPKTCGIYCITHVASGRQYIGKSVEIETRIEQHLGGYSDSTYLHNAVAKYGRDAFSWDVIEECSREEAGEREKYWIATLGSKSPHGFNLTDGGDGTPGWNHTDDAKRRMSELKKGRTQTAEHIEKNRQAQLGRRHSDESRAKMRASAPRGPNAAKKAAALLRWTRMTPIKMAEMVRDRESRRRVKKLFLVLAVAAALARPE